MDYKKTAQEILTAVGGEDNIQNMTHCATRLRLNLKDESIVDDNEVKNIDGVINIARAAGQYQILIGLEVPKVYEEFEKIVGVSDETKESKNHSDTKKSGSIISNIFSAISSIFAPLLPVLAGSGILRGLLILVVQMGLVNENSGTYAIWYVASMSVFYFLPVLLAVTSAKRFGASPYLSATIGAALISPDFIKLMGTHGNGAMTTFMKIPVVLMNYNSTVVPIILSIWIFSYLYKFLDNHVNENLKLVVVPMISLGIMIPLTMIAIGPLGVYGGDLVANTVNWAITHSRMLAGVLVGGGWSILVSFGIHWAVNPIMINNIATNGFDYICPLTFACNFAVMGTTIGVWLKARNKNIRSFSMTGFITVALSAIIEPTLFGLLVNNRKIWLSQIIGGAVGGAYLAIMRVATNAFVFGSITTFPAFIQKNQNNFIQAMIGLAISMIVSGIFAYFFTSRDEELA